MNTLREAAQQALTEMANARDYIWLLDEGGIGVSEEEMLAKIAKAIDALRAALAEPVKPLAEWQINDLIADIDPEDVCSWSFRQGVYAAEKHHGVKP